MNVFSSLAKPQYLFRPARCAARAVNAIRGERARRVELRLPWGVSIRVDTDERVGRAIWRSGVHDLPVAEALWRLLDPGDTAIDVGANIGYTAGLMAVRVGPSGRVLCIEPQPEVFQELEHNISLIRRHRDAGAVIAHRLALSDRAGDATLVCSEEFSQNRGSSRLTDHLEPTDVNRFTVTTRRLDEMLSVTERIAVLKIDVEGHELAVLKGAERALHGRAIEHIVYEDFGGPDSPVHALLGGHGYSVHGLGWRTHKPLMTDRQTGPAIDLSWESPNYLATLSPEKARLRFSRWGWSVI